jgi:indole-3-glycerol phosphate synthase
MKSILKEIYEYKLNQTFLNKSKISQNMLLKEISNVEKTRGFFKKISNNVKNNLTSIIAEVKKASPSKGIIKENFQPAIIAKNYEKGGASCISVLTDSKYFMGSNNDLVNVKKHSTLPVLRKDFIVSEYQIFESRAIGADCILLIAEILDKQIINNYIKLAKSLDLDVIVEVHSEEELKKYIDLKEVLIGINNRNLKSMDVDVNHSLELTKYLNYNSNIICESGINSFKSYKKLYDENFRIFLIGEYFMRSISPDNEIERFLNYG